MFSSFTIPIFCISCSSLISNYENNIYIEKVIDGDTFSSNNHSYRILGIDTPETYDSNNNFNPTSGPQYYYGTKAKNKAIELLNKKYVNAEIVKQDKYNRYVARITMDNNIDFASYMVYNGLAIVRYLSTNKKSPFYYYDLQYINELNNLQQEAKINKRGLWKENSNTLKQIYPK